MSSASDETRKLSRDCIKRAPNGFDNVPHPPILALFWSQKWDKRIRSSQMLQAVGVWNF